MNQKERLIYIFISIAVVIFIIFIVIGIVSTNESNGIRENEYIQNCKSEGGVANTHDYEWKCTKL
jgi:hypothetical protein